METKPFWVVFQGFINDLLAYFSSGPTVVPSFPLLSEKKQKQEEEIGTGEKGIEQGGMGGGIRGTGMSHEGSLPIADNAFIYNWLVRAVEANM